MRKARSASVPPSVRLPSRTVREKFLITYELEGCQKAVDYLTEYYGIKKMKIVLDGRKVPKECYGYYSKNKAYFTKEGLKRRVVLHELYHHLIYSKDCELPTKTEEREANNYTRDFLGFFRRR